MNDSIIRLFVVNSGIPCLSERTKRLVSMGYLVGIRFVYCVI